MKKSPPPPRTSEAALTSQVDFRVLYHTLRERAWVVLLCLVLAACATAAYLLRAPRIYAAKLVLQVEQEEQKILNIQRVQQEDLQGLEVLKTIEQTLQNRSLFDRVIEVNGLATNANFVTAGSAPSREQLVSRLAGMVESRLRKGTRLIDVKVEHTDPALTALVGNSLVREFLRMNYEQDSAANELAGEFLKSEETRLKTRLEQSENAMQAYKEQTGSVSLEERQNVVVEKLKELSQKVTEAKSRRIVNETARQQILALGSDVAALLTIPAVAEDKTVSDLRAQVARLESDLANLRQRYREKHPKLIQASSQLAEWKNALNRAVLNVPQTIRAAYDSARATELALEKALREQETVALELNKHSLRYNALAREVESDRALYQSVINRIKETSLTKEIKPSKVRVIQQARVPEKPVKPEAPKVILFGVLAGLGGGLMLALLLNACDRSLKTVDQTEEYLGLPVLAAIPKFLGAPADQRKLITADDADCTEAESFRTLRTALSMLGRKEDRRIFLYTSALPSEGKTFCSINYALSLAQQGLRTVIIDCDLRRPMVEKTLLNNNRRGFGLTDYLTGQKEFQQVLHTTGTENFAYIPAGTNTPNPAELLAKTGIDGLIDEALLHFDRVIVDSAPIHAVSDTLLILNRIQTLCLVVRSRKTPRNAVLRAVQLLREAGAPLAGVILNLVPRRRGGYGYYYDSYYEYGYHGKYQEKDRTPSEDRKAA